MIFPPYGDDDDDDDKLNPFGDTGKRPIRSSGFLRKGVNEQLWQGNSCEVNMSCLDEIASWEEVSYVGDKARDHAPENPPEG